MTREEADDLVGLWFDGWSDDEPVGEGDPCMARWWGKDPALDLELKERFGAAHLREAADVDADDLLTDGVCAVARVLLLDQIPRNIYRNTAHSFATDGLARATARRITAERSFYEQLPPIHRYFVLMPFMHGESVASHARARQGFVELAQAMAGTVREGVFQSGADFEEKHRVIIDRFGRYPHRNAVLGRESTAEELAFLQQPGSSF